MFLCDLHGMKFHFHGMHEMESICHSADCKIFVECVFKKKTEENWSDEWISAGGMLVKNFQGDCCSNCVTNDSKYGGGFGMMFGLGDKDKFRANGEIQFKKAGSEFYKMAKAMLVQKSDDTASDEVLIHNAVHMLMPTDATVEQIAFFCFGMRRAAYSFTLHKSKKIQKAMPEFHIFTTHDMSQHSQMFAVAGAVGAGKDMTMDLGNEPSNKLGTIELKNRIVKEFSGDDAFSVDVLDESKMSSLGMESLLSIARCSKESDPPYLCVIKYTGDDSDPEYSALIGKGVVFDTGGISIKPSRNMEDQKCDMGGAATVCGVMKSIKSMSNNLRPRKNLYALMPIVKNMPGSNAICPGDVVKSFSGHTIEIKNTDAEGRMILIDAIAYAEKELKVKCITTFATLTGAVVVALGNKHTGVMCTDNVNIEALKKHAIDAGEPICQLPLPEMPISEYMKSETADFANIQHAMTYGGTSAAAGFLHQAISNKDIPFIHFDIAGTAFNEGKATGKTVYTVVKMLMDSI